MQPWKDIEANTSEHTTIWEAIAHRNIASVKKFLAAPLAAPTDWGLSDTGESLLTEAIGDVKILKMILDAGIPVDTLNKYKETAAFVAALEGCIDALKLLHSYGADIEFAIDGMTLLWVASQAGRLECVMYLTNSGANINCRHTDNRTAVWQASQNDHPKVVKWLLDAGADPNASRDFDKVSPLHIAAQRGRVQVVETLIQGGADVNQPNHVGTTPCMKYRQVVRLLLRAGADPYRRNKNGYSVL